MKSGVLRTGDRMNARSLLGWVGPSVRLAWVVLLWAGAAGAQDVAPGDRLFEASAVTLDEAFTAGIEGPACDAIGNVYAVNFEQQGTIGRVTPDGVGEIFITLPQGSVGNGIRFGPSGQMYIADYVGHNIFEVDTESRALSVHAHDPTMNQPNDLAIGQDGTLYASDPNWDEGTGQLWRISPDGEVTRLAADMGTTNGIEVSPDGRTLYVAESEQRRIWAFALDAEGDISAGRVVIRFSDHGLDGMRADVDGNLYVTRYGAGTVLKISPEGRVLREVAVLGERPSNICLGGVDGRTAYVTEVEHRRLVRFRVDRPGLAWSRLR